MAIADTISSMYENVDEVYDTITNVDVNNGTNLFGSNNFKIEMGTISAVGDFGYSTERVRAYWIEAKENTTYHITTSNSNLQIVPYYYNSSKTFISFDSGWKNFPFTFTTPANTKYIAFLFKNSTDNPTPSSLTEIMLNEGSTALPYQPYTDNPTYKNIENIPKVIRNSYLEIMNNGIDEVWNNWEKVTGSGTELSLSPTIEAPMKNVLNGNTYQSTTILPSEYTQVDYIESTDTQYIDTGIIPNNTQNYYFTYALNNITQNQVLLGSRSSGNLSNSTNQVFYNLNIDTDTSKFASKFILGTNLKETIISEIQTNRVYSTSLKISDYTSNYDNQSTKNFYLMGFNNVNNFAAGFRGKLYVCKIYDNNILVRNFVPCYRNSDNEVGLYDLVNNVFYTNSGTGAFTYGSTSVSLPSPDFPIPINVVSGDNTIIVSNSDNTQSQSYPITLPEGMFLGWIPNTTYQDKIFKNTPNTTDYDSNLEDNVWYLKKEIGKIESYNGETITTSYISATGGLDTGSTIYYGLVTPTITEITDSTLLSQLEALYNAKSKNSQTNISQENNDLPFILDVTALKQLTQ